MRSFAILAAYAALASAQSVDVSPTGPPMGVYKTEAYDTAVTAVTVTATDDSSATSTAAAIAKRDATCVAQPTGILHVTSPDTAAGFTADTFFSSKALAAAVPSGYTQAFSNLLASNNADNYQGFTLLSTYDVASCASQCNNNAGCYSFNIYYERDPSVNPDDPSCSNPSSVTQIKCVWWGGLVSSANAVNYGQWRSSFQVVIAGSNGYYNTSAASALKAAAASSTTSAGTAQSTSVSTAGNPYTIYYGSDSTTGAFANSQASTSYTDCMTSCDNTATCMAFTYVGGSKGVGAGTCWLKTSLGSPTAAAAGTVSGAKSAVSSSSSSSSSSTVATTPSASSTAAQVSSSNIASSTLSSSSSTTSSASPNVQTPQVNAATSSSSSSRTTSASTTSSTLSTTSSALSSSTTSSALPTTSSALSTTSSALSSSTTLSTTTSSPTPTTFATSTKSTTTSTTASTTSSTPSAQPTFYLQVGPSKIDSNPYAVVASGGLATVSTTNSKSSASKFTIDSNGFLYELNPTTGYKAGTQEQVALGDWELFKFSAPTVNIWWAICQLGSTYLTCDVQGQFMYAGMCNNDGQIYFGQASTKPGYCSWTGLYPVLV